jgi:hypothetical protein
MEAISNIGIRAGERTFRLGDIAQVSRGVADPATYKMRYQGNEAIGLGVSMRKGGDVIRLGERLSLRRGTDSISIANRCRDPPGIRSACGGEALGG